MIVSACMLIGIGWWLIGRKWNDKRGMQTSSTWVCSWVSGRSKYSRLLLVYIFNEILISIYSERRHVPHIYPRATRTSSGNWSRFVSSTVKSCLSISSLSEKITVLAIRVEDRIKSDSTQFTAQYWYDWIFFIQVSDIITKLRCR